MAKAPKNEGRGNLRDREFDNLTVIKGIGTKTQKWLRQSLNVHTLQDLASLSADETESRLRAEGRNVSRAALDDWIAQAKRTVKEIAAIHSTGSPKPEIGPSRANQTAANLATTQPRQAEPPRAKKDWKPFATFVVEFQRRNLNGQSELRTTAHHVEDDRDVVWAGTEREEIHRWMLERLAAARERAEERREEMPNMEALAAESPPVTVQITQVRLRQSPEIDLPLFARGYAYPGYVQGTQPFVLETTFRLSGPGAADAAKSHARFVGQVYAHNLSTRQDTFLGETKPESLVDSEFSYIARLAEAHLAPGMYRLDCLASLQRALAPPAYQRLPLLQVA